MPNAKQSFHAYLAEHSDARRALQSWFEDRIATLRKDLDLCKDDQVAGIRADLRAVHALAATLKAAGEESARAKSTD